MRGWGTRTSRPKALVGLAVSLAAGLAVPGHTASQPHAYAYAARPTGIDAAPAIALPPTAAVFSDVVRADLRNDLRVLLRTAEPPVVRLRVLAGPTEGGTPETRAVLAARALMEAYARELPGQGALVPILSRSDAGGATVLLEQRIASLPVHGARVVVRASRHLPTAVSGTLLTVVVDLDADPRIDAASIARTAALEHERERGVAARVRRTRTAMRVFVPEDEVRGAEPRLGWLVVVELVGAAPVTVYVGADGDVLRAYSAMRH